MIVLQLGSHPFGNMLTHNFQIVKLRRQNLHYSNRKVCVVDPSTTLTPSQYISYIDQMPNVMKPYIEKIVIWMVTVTMVIKL